MPFNETMSYDEYNPGDVPHGSCCGAAAASSGTSLALDMDLAHDEIKRWLGRSISAFEC